MTTDFLLNQVAQLSEYLIIIAILIFNNVAAADIVVDML